MPKLQSVTSSTVN